jgi:hypothetical protein
MPFYTCDNVTTWIYSVFTEEYENEDAERQKSLMSAITEISIHPLRAYTQDTISSMISDEMLDTAVMNSVDLHELKRLLMEWANDTTCRKCYHYTDGGDCDRCEEYETCKRCATDYKKEHFDTKGLCCDCGGWLPEGEAEGSDTDA